MWSTGGLGIKSVDWNPLAIASARSLIAGVFMILLTRKQYPIFKRPSRGTLVGALILCGLSLTFVSATKLTTAANAVLLQYCAPVWVALAAPFILKERTRRLDWVFIGLTLFGMVLFFLDSISAEGLLGIIVAIFASVFFGGMAMSVRYNNDGGGPPFGIMIYGNLMVFLAGLYFWRAPWPDFGDIMILLALGLFQYGLPYYLFTQASRGVTSLELVLIPTLEPILNPIWVFLFLGEQPGNWAIAGGITVFCSVTVWSVFKNRRGL